MQSPKRAYSFGLAGAVTARGLSVVAGMLSLWLLARILDPDDFAGYAAAMSYAILLGHVGGLGIERSMLLRISPLVHAPATLHGRGMMLRIAVVVLALSTLLALGTLAILDAFPALQGGRTDDWIARLWPVIPAQALLLVLGHWYQSNHWVGLSQMMPGVNDAARCIAFVVVFFAGLGTVAVASGAFLAILLPILILLVISAGRSLRDPVRLDLSDVTAGMQFLAMRFSMMGLRQIDLVVMGFVVGGIGTAAYAVASRIADVAMLGQQAFVQTYAPRVRRHLANGDGDAITREYNATRALSFLLTLGVAFVVVLAGEWALGLFGDFAEGFPVLLLVVAGHLLTSTFGGHDVHLSMTGHLAPATANRLLALLVFVVMLALLVPRYEGIGAALSFVGASAVYSVTGALLLRRQSAMPMLHPAGIGAGLLSSAVLVGVALTGQSAWIAAVCLVLSAAITLLGEAALLRRALYGSGLT